MRRRVSALALLFALAGVAWLATIIRAPGHTRLELTDGETGRALLSAVLRDGEPITLTWRNSLFGLDVTEAFVAQGGLIVQTQVTFADPRGLPPMQVAPDDVDDLYHTGGPFTATGLRRPFTRIVYRVGEIGEPKLAVRGRVIEFKREVGFGGRVILSTARPSLFDWVR
jgi:hypothetical protein